MLSLTQTLDLNGEQDSNAELDFDADQDSNDDLDSNAELDSVLGRPKSRLSTSLPIGRLNCHVMEIWYGSRPRQSLDGSDLDFDLSLDLDIRGQKYKTAITQLFLKLGG